MQKIRSFFVDFAKEESGASAAEYALILAIVTTGIAVAVVALGDAINTAVTAAAACITTTGCG